MCDFSAERKKTKKEKKNFVLNINDYKTKYNLSF